MKSFLVLLNEKQPNLLNERLLKAHIDYLKQLHTDGYLTTCGPFTNNQSAVLVIKADSKIRAEELINNDPFIKESYYKSYVINEFEEASKENNWLIDNEPKNLNKSKKLLENNLTANSPKTISVLYRKLKSGKDYEDFRQAWLPPVKNPQDKSSFASYFSDLVQVINAKNLNDPSEIISIGLIWADWKAIQQEIKHVAQTEKMRHERIATVADKIGETKIYQVMDVDKLGE